MRGVFISLSALQWQGLHELTPILGVSNVQNHVNRAMATIRASEQQPLPVLAPVSFEVGDGSPLRPMFFVPDLGGGGWLITEERWEQRLNHVTAKAFKFLQVSPPSPSCT